MALSFGNRMDVYTIGRKPEEADAINLAPDLI